MGTDILEKLAELPVPPAPPPVSFDRALHQRINSRLLAEQFVDLLVRGFAYGIIHFSKAVIGLIRFTLTGRFESPNSKLPEPPV
jgi:hypothetical protein